jgi:hypothetical protein
MRDAFWAWKKVSRDSPREATLLQTEAAGRESDLISSLGRQARGPKKSDANLRSGLEDQAL